MQECIEGFQKHSWGDDGACKRGCGATKTNGQVGPASPAGETLEGIAQELEQGQTPKSKDSKWGVRKAKAQAEDQARKLLARANAKSFVKLAEGGKKIAFRSAGLTCPELGREREEDFSNQLTRILEVLEYDISNPYVMIALFLGSYGEATYEQYLEAAESAESEPR